MFIHPWDAGTEQAGRQFARERGFGELVAAGRGRDLAVVVPTQFVLTDEDEILVHLLRTNPVWPAIEENPNVLLAVSGDWAFVPSDWKVVGGEDPALGIPTTYYASVQLAGEARILTEPPEIAAVLRRQLATFQPGVDIVDPTEHGPKLNAIQAMRVRVTQVRAKFKYGGNVDDEHRSVVLAHLEERQGPGDLAAAARVRASFSPPPSNRG
jgi:transcriptional regulator